MVVHIVYFFVGVAVGIFATALCVAAKEDKPYREIREREKDL